MVFTALYANTHVTLSLCLVHLCVQRPYHTKSMPCTGMCAMPLPHQAYAFYSNVCKYLCHTKPMFFTAMSANTLAQECVQIPMSHQVHAIYRNVSIYPCHTKPMPCAGMCANIYHTKTMPCTVMSAMPLLHQAYASTAVCNTPVTPSLCLVQYCVQYLCHIESMPN